MKALEKAAADRGISEERLMETAGKRVFLAVKKKMDLADQHVVIFAGHGSNGGDGFVAARYFAEVCNVIVLFFGQEEKLGDAALQNYRKIKDSVPVIEVQSQEDLEKFRIQQRDNIILVDALLGTGVKGEVRGPVSLGINYYNSLLGYKVAVDVPSGMHPDTGEGTLVGNADLIVALHDVKVGLESMQEKCVVVDIGL